MRTSNSPLHATWEAAAQVLKATGREDAVLARLEAFRGYDEWGVYSLLVTLSRSPEPSTARLAAELQAEVDERALANNAALAR